MDDRSPLSATNSGLHREVQPSDEGPTLDNLSLAQPQHLLEGALWREVDEAHAMSLGAVLTAPSLLNSSLVPGATSSGKRVHHTGVFSRVCSRSVVPAFPHVIAVLDSSLALPAQQPPRAAHGLPHFASSFPLASKVCSPLKGSAIGGGTKGP